MKTRAWKNIWINIKLVKFAWKNVLTSPDAICYVLNSELEVNNYISDERKGEKAVRWNSENWRVGWTK